MRLPEFGVKFPVTNFMIFFAILIVGLFSLSKLPVDLMPEIEPAAISVVTVYEGAGAEDVESKVTEIVENNLATVSNLDKITSRSMEGLSVVTCRFKWGINLDEASNDVRDKLEFAKRTLPDEIETPIVFKFNTAMIPILFMGANADVSYPQLYHIIDKQIGDYLKTIPGVGSVQIIGALERQINVKIDRAKLEGYHLSVGNISDRLARENVTLPAGDLKIGYTDYDLRVPGEYTNTEEMKNIIIAQQDDKIVYLKDVAEVEDSFKEETMIVRNNGKSGLMVMIQKRSGANTVEVAKKIQGALKTISKRLPRDVNLVILMDSSEHIIQSIKDLTGTIYWGGIFVILVVYLFLRQIRASIIIALTIPFSLIICFIFMYMLGYTINVMSLSSLAIAIGMVVDNAIVIVDNVMRHREKGEKPKEAAIFGSSEVGLAIAASTFTTVVVFLPMMFLSGITGIMFRQLAILITVTLLASLFTALTFSAALCSKLLNSLPQENFKSDKKSLYQKFYEASNRYFEYIEKKYSVVLDWALKHKKTTVLIAISVFAFSIFLMSRVGTEFIPEEDTGDLNVQVELPVGTRVEETDKIAKKVEIIFKENIPEMVDIFSRSGQSSSGRFGAVFGGRIGSNIIVVGAKLQKLDKRTRPAKEIAEAIRPKIQALPGVKKLNISAGSPFSRILFGGGKP
ncbi:MAG: efflux RND transporter permease subunit, partial [Candidatus Omnitrophica bacterium]|nr:efflux RND transporter permease subunit [Candidatus Omnitrophota bacterium]